MNTEIWLLVCSTLALTVSIVVVCCVFDVMPGWLFGGMVLLATVGLIGLGGGLSGIWSRHECDVQGGGLGLETRWTYAGGCQVRDDGRWIPIEGYRFYLEETE